VQIKENIKKDRAIQVAAILISLVIVFYIIYVSQAIILPLILAFIFAIILLPLHRFFVNRFHFPNIFAALFSLIIALGSLVVLIFVMSNQIASIFQDIPEIMKNMEIHFTNFQKWLNDLFHVSLKEQSEFLNKNVKPSEIIPQSSFKSIGGITDVLMNCILVPIYTFLVLIYRNNFIKFFEFFAEKTVNLDKNIFLEIINEIKIVIRSYVIGLIIELIIVALLTGFGLWILGVKYFIFLGILTAILNLIPYIGILIACTISILMTLVGSNDLSIISGIIIVNIIVQFIDNNILIPKIIGSKVSINALASMIGVIVGGSIAGIGGMFLALPILAIIKIICDRVEKFKAFGYLIGDHSKTDISNLLRLKIFKTKNES
jgi:predicted PurR-regulated permease PerM